MRCFKKKDAIAITKIESLEEKLDYLEKEEIPWRYFAPFKTIRVPMRSLTTKKIFYKSILLVEENLVEEIENRAINREKVFK